MGYIVNHAIIVESDETRIEAHHVKALEIFKPCLVSNVVSSKMNGSCSFFIAPDGSKEGWDASEVGNERRTLFKEYLKTTTVDWVEVAFGGDEPDINTKINDHSGVDR